MQLPAEIQSEVLTCDLKTIGARTELISTGPELVLIDLAQLRAISLCSFLSGSKYSCTAIGHVVQENTCTVQEDFVQLY